MSESRPTCSRACRDGSPCRAACLPGRDACLFHSPEHAAARAAGRRQGGQTRSRRAAVLATAGDVVFASVGDAIVLLAETASQVRRGEIDVRVANSLFYGASVALRALMPDEIQKQVDAQRQRVDQLRRERNDDANVGGPQGPAPAGGAAGVGDPAAGDGGA